MHAPKNKVRPWIHPEAIAALVREGQIEDKDITAMIRLYVRVQVAWHQKANRGYWEGNETIAKELGVPLHQVENAIRRSAAISRENDGKGRGKNKRFVMVEPAITPAEDSQIDGCHQSDRRMETVKLTDDTSQIDGCHRNRRKRKEDKGTQKVGRKDRASRRAKPTCLPDGDSSSMITEEEAEGMLAKYDLMDPHELPRAYYSLLSKCSGAPLNAAEKDIAFAIKFLDSLPANLRRREVISAGLVWYCRSRPKTRDKTWWFTSFSGSWGDFRSRAETIAEAAATMEQEQREAECRREKEGQEADRKAKHEAFVAELPARESVVAAIKAVSAPETFGYNDALKWIGTLVASPGLGLTMENSPYEYKYIESAYRTVQYEPRAMIEKTRVFFGRIILKVLERLRGDEACHELMPMKIKWENFCDHFGLEERKARLCPFRIPAGALKCINSRDSGQQDSTDT